MACSALYLLHAPIAVNAQWYSLFLLAITAAAYNYMRLSHKPQPVAFTLTGYKKWVERNAAWVAFFSAFFVALSFYFIYKIWSLTLLIYLLPPALISFVYPLNTKWFSLNRLPLRQIPGIKLFLISFSWAYMVILLPALLFAEVDNQVLFNFTFTLLLVAALTIPFDVRDLRLDDPAMRTLPAQLGRTRSLAVSRFILGICQILSILGLLFFEWGLAKSLALLLALEFAQLLVRKMPREGDEFYTGFWIEGIPILGFILFWLLSYATPYLSQAL